MKKNFSPEVLKVGAKNVSVFLLLLSILLVLFPFDWLEEVWPAYAQIFDIVFATALAHHIGHATIFFIAAILIIYAFPFLLKRPLLYLLVLLLGAVAEETLQALFKPHLPSWGDGLDILYDFVGIVLAYVVISLWRWIRHRKPTQDTREDKGAQILSSIKISSKRRMRIAAIVGFLLSLLHILFYESPSIYWLLAFICFTLLCGIGGALTVSVRDQRLLLNGLGTGSLVWFGFCLSLLVQDMFQPYLIVVSGCWASGCDACLDNPSACGPSVLGFSLLDVFVFLFFFLAGLFPIAVSALITITLKYALQGRDRPESSRDPIEHL